MSPDGRYLATGGTDKRIVLWRLEQEGARPQRLLQGHGNRVVGLRFTPDGRLLSASYDNTMRLWDTASGTTLRIYQGHPAGYDGRVGVFDVASGKGELFAAHEGNVANVTFDQTGEHLPSAGIEEFRLRLWDLTQTPPEPRDIARVQHRLLWAALRPDGHQLAAVGRDQYVTLYDLAPDPTPPRRLVGHESTVYRAAYTPDGAQLATVSADMTLRLWDLGRDKLLFSLRLPTEFRSPSPLWDFALRCLPADAPGPHAGHCWIAVPLTMGRLALYRLPYQDPPDSLRP